MSPVPDKSKNGKMATLVVMYTLKRQGRYLMGPINRWVYGSFAPKKHAFMIAQREANKRGFTPESGKQVQLLTDGDPDLEQYGKTHFPETAHTLDVIHVVEKLWEAGACIHPEGSDALRERVELQKQRLYGSPVTAIIGELVRHWEATPKTGPAASASWSRPDRPASVRTTGGSAVLVQRQRAWVDAVFGAGLDDEPPGVRGVLAAGHHPADDVATEDTYR